MKLAPLALCALLALVLTAAAPGQHEAARRSTAHPKPLLPAQRDALLGIDRARAHHVIDARTAAADRAIVNRAARLIRHLPSSRASVVAASLSQAARLSHRYTRPRALILFSQLSVTSSHLAHESPPAQGKDVTDADGVLYRFFADRGYVFHPLGNFSALGLVVKEKRTAEARRLATALADRGATLADGAMGWEAARPGSRGWPRRLARRRSPRWRTSLAATRTGGGRPPAARTARSRGGSRCVSRRGRGCGCTASTRTSC